MMREALDVIDLSVSGLALSSAALAETKSGDKLRLHITLGSTPEHVVEATVRWSSAAGTGVELVDPPARTAQGLGKYIAELLERGGSS